MVRLFIAIELPPEVQEVLGATQSMLARQPMPVRWVDPAGTHLTLKFLGATSPERVGLIEAALDDVARRHHPFLLKTAGVGSFPNRKAPRVIWLGVAGDLGALGAIQQDVEQFVAPLGYPTERRAFNPHLTLGRTNKGTEPVEVARIGQVVSATTAPAPVTWQVSRVSLMRSERGPGGPRYLCLRAWTLTESVPLI